MTNLSVEDVKFLEELDEYRRYHHVEFFEPYPKQREFFRMGKFKNERTLFAGNQYGKSEAGGYETSCHVTGLYPPDWDGRVWNKPVTAWAAGESTTVVRDVQQTKLFGPPGLRSELGTGFIPRECIAGDPKPARGAVADAYDTVPIRHYTDGSEDGISHLFFKSYEQGRKKFQGSTVDFVWWDEEPDESIYTEGNARWTATGGMSFMTFTPLQGMSNVVKRIRQSTDPLIGFVTMGPKDALHMTEEKIRAMLSKYPEYQWRARMEGLPMLGTGAIFNANEAFLRFDPGMDIPDFWVKLWGIDFGISHPFAAVLCMWDRENDVFYVLKSYRAANTIPMSHADAILRMAGAMPVAWPHDGNRRESSGEQLASQYRKYGLKMMEEHATFPQGGYSTEAAILEMQQRMSDGRFRVASDLVDWWEEFRMYHRDENGQIVKKDDDLLSATMKALMMKRMGRTGTILPLLRRPDVGRAETKFTTDFDVLTGRPFSVI
jgi:phage terminase large subunit-like protein